MRGRGWFRDFIHHFILILLFGVGLYFVWRRVVSTPELAEIVWLRWLLYASLAVFAILFAVFANSVLSSSYLERFDPGKPGSLKRLDKIGRFRLRENEAARLEAWEEPILQVSHLLREAGYEESARWTFGIVYEKTCPKRPFEKKQKVDRFFLYYKPMLNVLIVDHVLKECMGYIAKFSAARPAPRNALLFVTDMTDRDEVTSAAAGVVNFLGRIGDGSLSPMLLDLCFGRLFYPLDQSMIRFSHRKFQARLRRHIRQHILTDRALRRGERFERPADVPGMRKARLSVVLPKTEEGGPEGADAETTPSDIPAAETPAADMPPDAAPAADQAPQAAEPAEEAAAEPRENAGLPRRESGTRRPRRARPRAGGAAASGSAPLPDSAGPDVQTDA